MPAIFYNARILEAMIAFLTSADPTPSIEAAALIALEHRIGVSVNEVEQIAQLVLQNDANEFMATFKDRLAEKHLSFENS
jgi:hypothetical protein